jgi:alcohol dehydrogenase
MNSVQGGLAVNGTLLVIGAVKALAVDALQLLRGRRSIKGWYSGTSIDSQQTLAFSALNGVRSMNEILPLERAAEGYQRMITGQARFRVVLTTGN